MKAHKSDILLFNNHHRTHPWGGEQSLRIEEGVAPDPPCRHQDSPCSWLEGKGGGGGREKRGEWRWGGEEAHTNKQRAHTTSSLFATTYA